MTEDCERCGGTETICDPHDPHSERLCGCVPPDLEDDGSEMARDYALWRAGLDEDTRTALEEDAWEARMDAAREDR